jgi:hypothetical protein
VERRTALINEIRGFLLASKVIGSEGSPPYRLARC